jgi:hypothetical protein
MKNTLKMMLTFFSAMMIATISSAQDVPADFKSDVHKPADLKANHEKHNKDKGWQELTKQLEGKGYKKNSDDKASWGFKANYTEKGKKEEASFNMYEFTNASGESATAIWLQKGGKTYKAYITLPKGTTDIDKAEVTEMYADGNNKIQKAHSWFTCFRDNVRKSCGSKCSLSVITKCTNTSTNVFNYVNCLISAPGICRDCISFWALNCI